MASLLFSITRWRLVLAALSFAGALFAGEVKPTAEKNETGNYNIPLWDEGKVPVAKGNGPLDNPFLTVSLPAAGKRNGGSVVVAPGGGNIMLLYGLEGLDIAERYNEWGVAAFILTYRLSPRYDENARVLDGKRAIQVIRSRAAEWKLDPHRVGFIGFSAGFEPGPLRRCRIRRWRTECNGPRGPLQLSTGLPGPGVRSGPGLAGRIAQRLSPDIPDGRGRRQIGGAWFGAVVHGFDTSRSDCRASHLSKGQSRLRQRLWQRHFL